MVHRLQFNSKDECGKQLSLISNELQQKQETSSQDIYDNYLAKSSLQNKD